MSENVFEYADFGKRVIAFLIDMLIFMIGLFILASALQLFGLSLLPDFAGMSSEEVIQKMTSGDKSLQAYNFTTTLLNILYFAHFESREKQATPGKQMMGLKVVHISGEPLNLLQACIRNGCKIISQLILFVGYFFPLFTSKKQALHDLLASTIIINSTYEKNDTFVENIN